MPTCTPITGSEPAPAASIPVAHTLPTPAPLPIDLPRLCRTLLMYEEIEREAERVGTVDQQAADWLQANWRTIRDTPATALDTMALKARAALNAACRDDDGTIETASWPEEIAWSVLGDLAGGTDYLPESERPVPEATLMVLSDEFLWGPCGKRWNILNGHDKPEDGGAAVEAEIAAFVDRLGEVHAATAIGVRYRAMLVSEVSGDGFYAGTVSDAVRERLVGYLVRDALAVGAAA